MSKAILMSIQPKWVAKELNGEKTIEVRKKFPKDFVGWVYIYVTKGNGYLTDYGISKTWCFFEKGNDIFKKEQLERECYNGKVVARFWCDKVEEHRPFFHWCIEKETCLSRNEVLDYLDSKNEYSAKRHSSVYAIHISKLEIFDKPKELRQCMSWNSCKYCPFNAPYECNNGRCRIYRSIQKAPQNYMFIGEIEDE